MDGRPGYKASASEGLADDTDAPDRREMISFGARWARPRVSHATAAQGVEKGRTRIERRPAYPLCFFWNLTQAVLPMAGWITLVFFVCLAACSV